MGQSNCLGDIARPPRPSTMSRSHGHHITKLVDAGVLVHNAAAKYNSIVQRNAARSVCRKIRVETKNPGDVSAGAKTELDFTTTPLHSFATKDEENELWVSQQEEQAFLPKVIGHARSIIDMVRKTSKNVNDAERHSYVPHNDRAAENRYLPLSTRTILHILSKKQHVVYPS